MTNVTTEDTKKCPFCAETIKSEAILCRFCKSDLKQGQVPKIINDTPVQASGHRVFYFKPRVEKCGWVEADTEEEARQWVLKHSSLKKVDFFDLNTLIQKMAAEGWTVSFQNEKVVTFRRMKSRFDAGVCIFLLLFFIIPAIIYAIATSSPKEETLSFPVA